MKSSPEYRQAWIVTGSVMNDTMTFTSASRVHAPEIPETEDLEPFFSPRSVAVIGASPKLGNLGAKIVASIRAHGYQGKVTVVNPRGEAIPPCQAVRSPPELSADTDLAIAAVSAQHVPGLLKPLAERGIHHLIVIGGGFAETGKAGEKLQKELKEAAAKFSIRVIGPNGLGVFSAVDRFNSLFLSPEDVHLPKPGPIALISQSGVFLSLLLNQLADMNIGVHRAVSFGNRVDVDELELLTAFANDPAVSVIGLYLESFKDGASFVELARKVTQEKPIVIFKGGHSDRGCTAAQSHSSSLAGSYPVFQAACDKAGLIEVRGFEEFQIALQVLATLPVPRGDRTLIISNGGGMGVFLTDLCERYGLRIPKPSESLQSSLRKHLPEYYSLNNPIDLTGSGTNEQCAQTAEKLMQSGEFDCLLMVLLSGTEGIDAGIAPLLRGRFPEERPAIIGAYGEPFFSSLEKELQQSQLPVFPSTENAVLALSILTRRRRILDTSKTQNNGKAISITSDWADDWKKRFHHNPSEMEIKSFLNDHGIAIPGNRSIKKSDELAQAAEELGFPLVLKAISSGLQHKTELNAVRLGIGNLEELILHWKEMQKTWPFSVWAEEQMPPGLDLMVGFHHDPQFGPLLVFGSGGKYVEVFQDVQRVLLPATTKELSRMVDMTGTGTIIRGTRGDSPLNKNALLDFLERTSQLMIQLPEIESLDFNPVRLYEEGLVVLDAKAALKCNAGKGDDCNDEPLY
jgi:acetate---CoA ligase (ADP-forming)